MNYTMTKEDDVFVAQCLDIDVASDGGTEQEALDNLLEALALRLKMSAAAASASVDETVAYCEASNRRIDKMEASAPRHDVLSELLAQIDPNKPMPEVMAWEPVGKERLD